MNKNTLIFLLSAGVILFGFSWYNNKQYAERVKEQQRLDSIELANRPVVAENEPATAPDSLFVQAAAAQSDTLQQPAAGTLTAARQGKEQFSVLENDQVRISLSNKGGRVASVRLKEYKTYKGDSLMLFRPDGSTFGLNNLCLPQPIHTADYYFELAESSAEHAVYRLRVDSASYLDFVYTLKPNYGLDFRIDLSHLEGVIPRNQPDLVVDWALLAPKQEKGFDNENNYTTVAYRTPSETTIEELGAGTGRKEEEITTKVNWVAFKQQFFSSILVAKESFSASHIAYETFQPTDTLIKAFKAELTLPYQLNTQGYDLTFYFGPNKYSVLKKYGDLEFQKLVPLGWWIIGWINRWVVIPVFDFLGGHIASFGLIILILTLLIKIVIFPLTYKSYLSTAKMRVLKPDIDKINEKYPKKEDAMKKQQATMEVYRSAGVNPMGGCLPLLIQMPILIAMFRFFPASIELRGESFLWADDLSSYDSILNLPFNIPFYGDHISLFTLLMAVSVYLSSKINFSQTAGMSNNQMPGMKFMMLYLMPVMLLLWFNNYSAGLSYYYLLSNVITIGQTVAFRSLVDDKKLHAQMKENAKKPRKKSKWQERLEEMQKQQQQQARRK